MTHSHVTRNVPLVAYVKLDTKILDSTLWVDREAREIFVTALLMAEPREFPEPVPQISVRTLDFTGWSAPAGWYGWVPAAGVGIVRRAGTGHETGLDALERLGQPEPDSRNTAHEGRRLIRAEGGYLVLNYMRYRDFDHSAADRMRRLRARKRGSVTTGNGRHVTANGDAVSRIADADADAKDMKRGEKSARSARATRLPEDFGLTPERRAVAETEKLDADRIFANFLDYWTAASGAKARKCDWDATWRVWCRNQHGNGGNKPAERRKTRYEEMQEALANATES